MRARKAYSAGVVKPERRFPIILADTGPFTTPEDIQGVVGMESVPEVKWTIKTTLVKEDYNFDENDNEEKGRKEEKEKLGRP